MPVSLRHEVATVNNFAPACSNGSPVKYRRSKERVILWGTLAANIFQHRETTMLIDRHWVHSVGYI